MRELALHAPFEDLGTVHAALAAASAEKLSETFDTAGTRLLLRLPADDVDALKLRLRDATRNRVRRSEEHKSELQSLMRISHAVFCSKNRRKIQPNHETHIHIMTHRKNKDGNRY